MEPTSSTCLFEAGRQALGFTAESWRLFLLDWGGVERSDDLHQDTPEMRRGARRVLDRLYVAGYRAGTYMPVSMDYMIAEGNWRLAAKVQDRVLAGVMEAAGHPKGLPGRVMSGIVFRGLRTFYGALGIDTALPARTWMTPDRIAFLSDMQAAWRIDATRFRWILGQYGGGVASIGELDEEGDDRLQVALETGAGVHAARMAGRDRHVENESDPVRRLWLEWHRPLA